MHYIAKSYTDVNQWTISRTKQERKMITGSKTVDTMGYVREPLLDIEPNQCVPDFLHMKKGVINRLLNQV